MKKILHLQIDSKILEKLTKFSTGSKLNKTEIVERSIISYIKNKNGKEKCLI